MELIVRSEVLAARAYNAHVAGARAFPLACAFGSPDSREPALLAQAPWDPRMPAPPMRLSIAHAPFPIRRPSSWRFLAEYAGPLTPGMGVLWLGRGEEQGSFVGVAASAANRVGRPEPIVALRLIGPGLERIAAVNFDSAITLTSGEQGRWSRQIGALDEATWRRQRSLRVVVVGTGRLGSVVAATLARWGGDLTLVDFDAVELHNLDASDCLVPADLGSPKSAALAAHLLRLGTGGQVDAVVDQIDSAQGRCALADADVVVSCADDPRARDFAGWWARRYGLVLLDIGSAVRREGNSWRAGADVRLVLPGDGCLNCWGGVGDLAEPPAADWHTDRAGSLRTLNQLGAHAGLTLLEQLLAMRLARSTWLRVEIAPSGLPTLRPMPRTRTDACPTCSETFAGQSREVNTP